MSTWFVVFMTPLMNSLASTFKYICVWQIYKRLFCCLAFSLLLLPTDAEGPIQPQCLFFSYGSTYCCFGSHTFPSPKKDVIVSHFTAHLMNCVLDIFECNTYRSCDSFLTHSDASYAGPAECLFLYGNQCC